MFQDGTFANIVFGIRNMIKGNELVVADIVLEIFAK